MVTLGSPVEVIEGEGDVKGVTIKTSQELADLVEEAQVDPLPGHPNEAAHWCYRIPFPGVRHYDYTE
jgi:hypothetical protein